MHGQFPSIRSAVSGGHPNQEHVEFWVVVPATMELPHQAQGGTLFVWGVGFYAFALYTSRFVEDSGLQHAHRTAGTTRCPAFPEAARIN